MLLELRLSFIACNALRISHLSWTWTYPLRSELVQMELELFLSGTPKGSCKASVTSTCLFDSAVAFYLTLFSFSKLVEQWHGRRWGHAVLGDASPRRCMVGETLHGARNKPHQWTFTDNGILSHFRGCHDASQSWPQSQRMREAGIETSCRAAVGGENRNERIVGPHQAEGSDTSMSRPEVSREEAEFHTEASDKSFQFGSLLFLKNLARHSQISSPCPTASDPCCCLPPPLPVALCPFWPHRPKGLA